MKTKLGIIILLLVAILTAGCTDDKRETAQVVGKALAAVADRDEMELAKYVDLDNFFAACYDEGAADMSKEIAKLHELYPDDPFFWHDTAFMEKYTKEHKAEAMLFARGIRHSYFTGQTEGSYEEAPMYFFAGELEKFIAAGAYDITDVEVAENKATVTIKTRGDGTDYGKLIDGLEVKFALEKDGDGWKVKRIANGAELLYPVVDKVEEYCKLKGLD